MVADGLAGDQGRLMKGQCRSSATSSNVTATAVRAPPMIAPRTLPKGTEEPPPRPPRRRLPLRVPFCAPNAKTSSRQDDDRGWARPEELLAARWLVIFGHDGHREVDQMKSCAAQEMVGSRDFVTKPELLVRLDLHPVALDAPSPSRTSPRLWQKVAARSASCPPCLLHAASLGRGQGGFHRRPPPGRAAVDKEVDDVDMARRGRMTEGMAPRRSRAPRETPSSSSRRVRSRHPLSAAEVSAELISIGPAVALICS